MTTSSRRVTASDAPLARYNAKRDFGVTAEPEGRLARARTVAPLRFVIQKHWASRLHYDFRLELDGVMLSWAVPKGPSLDPAHKRMAVRVEDHPLSYRSFEGEIPAGHYGAGRVIVWDQGHWRPLGDPRDGLAHGKLTFELQGEKLRGAWELIRTSRPGSSKQETWLLIKRRGDAAVRPSDEFDVITAMPDSVLSPAPGSPRRAARPGSARRAALPARLDLQLATLAAEEFPNVDEGQAPALAAFAVAQSILKRLIEKTSFAMAQQDVRFYLCGMLLEISGGAGQLRGVATDGHRLAMYTVENIESVATGLLSNRVQAIIPRKGTLEIARLLKESEEPVRVQLTQHHLRIENSDVVIISKLVDGKFPDYEKVIPRGGDKVLLGERLALRDAFNRAAILSNEKYRGVRMQLDRDTLRLIASNPEQEQAEEELSVHYQGPQMEIGFNVGYLTDALAALDQNEARFTFSSAESSVLIDVPNDASGCYVVMPMKL